MIRKRKIVKIIIVTMCCSMFYGCGSGDKTLKQQNLNSSDVTLITKVLPYGEVSYAVACDFGNSVDNSTLSKEEFQVESLGKNINEGRTITKVYTNDALETCDSSKPGRYVIIELDSNDKNAPALTYDEKRDQTIRNELKYYVTIKENIKTLNGVNFNASQEKILAGKQVTPIVDDFKKYVYEDSKNNKLNYRLWEPKVNENQKYPLVVFLHGSGERGSDNTTQLLSSKGAISFAQPQNQEKNPCYVLAPQAPYEEIPTSYWCEEPMNSVLFDLIKDVANKYNVDTNRIYITGLSNGGDGVWNLIEENPKFFAAAMPMCGLSNSNYDITKLPAYAPIDQSNVENLKNIPIWAFQAADDPAVDVRNSREISDAIKKAGGTLINYTEFPEGTITPVGHMVWVKVYENQEAIDWLFKQSNNN